jgi:hypothetical protein
MSDLTPTGAGSSVSCSAIAMDVDHLVHEVRRLWNADPD